MKPKQTKKEKCEHEEDSLCYKPSPDEDGWECTCGEKLGFRPDLDRKFTDLKVRYILEEMCNPFEVDEEAGKLIDSPSNDTEANILINSIVEKCERKGMYDQQTIMKAILSDKHYINDPEHWKKESEKFLRNKKS